MMYPTEDSYLEFIKNSQNSIVKKKKKKNNNPIRKWTKVMNFSLKVRMAKKHMKKCSSSLTTREIQIKTHIS